MPPHRNGRRSSPPPRQRAGGQRQARRSRCKATAGFQPRRTPRDDASRPEKAAANAGNRRQLGHRGVRRECCPNPRHRTSQATSLPARRQSTNRPGCLSQPTASGQRPPGPVATAIRSFSPGLRSRSGACRPVRRHISTRSPSPHGAACPGWSSPPPPQGTPQPATQRSRRSQLNSSGPPVGHDRAVDPMRCEAKTRHQARTTLLAAAPRLGRTAWLPWGSPVPGSGRDWSEQEAAC